jgi:phospholipase A1
MLLSVSAMSQEVALKEILLQKTDTGTLDLKKPFYLEVEESELVNLFDRQPNFGVYHDNFFITGIPVNKKITKYSADTKFQISVRQRLFKSYPSIPLCS